MKPEGVVNLNILKSYLFKLLLFGLSFYLGKQFQKDIIPVQLVKVLLEPFLG